MPQEWVITELKGYEALELRDCKAEDPGPNDIRLRVEAFALNWGDSNLMEGLYSFDFSSLPARVGAEASGIVEAIGENVKGIKVGERYCSLPYFYDMRGCSAETVLIDQKLVTPAPEGLSAVESASVWMQFMTAYFPIVELAKAAPGQHIFIPAGTSTAGNAAIHIAKLQGATVISSTRSQTNVAYLLESGADHVFVDDGSGTDIETFLRDATAGKGVNASFDPVGGDFMERYTSQMAENGQLFFYGGLNGSFPNAPYRAMFQRNLWLKAYSLFNYVENEEACTRGKAFVYDALASGALTPNVDKVFAMQEYKQAWAYMLGPRSSYGKVVIETGV